MPGESQWVTLPEAADYACERRTKQGRRRIGPDLLKKAIKKGELRAVVIGGRKQFFTRPEWVDVWMVDQVQPVAVTTPRRRLG